MELAEITAYLDTNKDTEEVKNYIGGFTTPDRVNAFLNGEEGKKLLQPKLDTYHSKGMETWKANNLDGLVAAKVKELHPDADPKDIALNKLQAQLDKMQSDSSRKDLTNKTLKQFQDKKLPTDLVDFFIGQDDESTQKNLDKFLATMAAHDEAIKLEFAKGSSYIPPKGGNANLGAEEKMRAEISKFMK